MNAITGINPTFHLKKIKYDDIADKYTAGKYLSMPSIENTSKKCMGSLIYENGKIIGWKTVINSLTLIITFNHPLRGLCAHCELETTAYNICSFGIPEKIEKSKINGNDVINIRMDSETCSLECSAACIKKFGRVGISLSSKYMDANSMIRGLFLLYFPGVSHFAEAPALTEFVKFGGKKTPAVFRSELHFYYYKEEELYTVSSPKLVIAPS
jgi:hypothetical protein